MATSIGTVNFLTMRGRVAPAGMSLREESREGLNGHAYLKVGNRAPVSQLVTTADVNDVSTHVNACAALKGTLVTVVQPDGSSVSNVAILDCAVIDIRKLGTRVGGLGAYQYFVTMVFQVQATA